MKCVLVAVGDEVLFGDTVNTNGARLAARFKDAGGEVLWQEVVPDREDAIAEAVSRALVEADLVLTIGGLGPTRDDLTRQGVARALGIPLEESAAARSAVEAAFRSRGLRMPASNWRQALLPVGATMLPNARGSAPGFLTVTPGGRRVAVLPGPPHECDHVFQESLWPHIKDLFPHGRRVVWLRFADIGESALEEALGDLVGPGNPSLLPYAKRAEVHLRLAAEAATAEEAQRLLDGHLEKVRAKVGRHIYATDEASLEQTVLGLLRSRRETLATQESATGGWLAKRLTDPPGASDVYRGGTVVYTVDAKHVLGGLAAGDVERDGPVSSETAAGLAGKIREALRSTWGIATVGWAGPAGDGPVGQCFVGLAGPGGTRTQEFLFGGERDDVRFRLAQSALVMLWKAIRQGEGLKHP